MTNKVKKWISRPSQSSSEYYIEKGYRPKVDSVRAQAIQQNPPSGGSNVIGPSVSSKSHKKINFEMAKKTVKFNKRGIAKLPNDKPANYEILTKAGTMNYVGVAKRGRVQERLMEHLPGGKDYIPGSKVRIEQQSSIADAKQKEADIIARSRPKHNKQGK